MIIPETFRKYLNPREYMYWNRMYEMQQMKKRTSNIIRSLNDKTIDLIYVALVLEKKNKLKKNPPLPMCTKYISIAKKPKPEATSSLGDIPTWKKNLERARSTPCKQIRADQGFDKADFCLTVFFTVCCVYSLFILPASGYMYLFASRLDYLASDVLVVCFRLPWFLFILSLTYPKHGRSSLWLLLRAVPLS